MTRQTDAYFERFGFWGRQIAESPVPGLSLVVVIPCFNEPDLIVSLESLRRSERPNVAHEVIVVVNSTTNVDVSVLEQNDRTLRETRAWIDAQPQPKLTVHRIDARD